MEESDQGMSNKTEATFHGEPAYVGTPDPADPLTGEVDPAMVEAWQTGQLPVWADLAAQHGWSRTAQHEAPNFGAAGMHSWDNHRTPPRWVGLTLLLVGLTVVSAVLLGVLAQRNNWLPASVPLIGEDTGVAACEAIASGKPPVEASGKDTMTAAEYRQARGVFADSRYPAIRDNGVKIIDLAWQAQNASGEDLAAMMFGLNMAEAYSGLAGGCAAVGYTIPSI
jgi:hypothetical protein